MNGSETNNYKKPDNIFVVPIDHLKVHYYTDTPPGYQREPTQTLLGRMKLDGYDEDLSPVIDVVKRVWQNGDIYVVDGGTRLVGAKRQGLTHMVCKFHPDIKTFEEEAKLFFGLNKKRSCVPIFNQYAARLQYHDVSMVKLEHMISKCGFTMGKTAGYHILGGPARLEELMKGNPVALESALKMLYVLTEDEKYPAIETLLRGLYYLAANIEDKTIFDKKNWVYKRLMNVGATMLTKHCNEHTMLMRTRSTKTLGDAMLEQINYRAMEKNKIRFKGGK